MVTINNKTSALTNTIAVNMRLFGDALFVYMDVMYFLMRF